MKIDFSKSILERVKRACRAGHDAGAAGSHGLRPECLDQLIEEHAQYERRLIGLREIKVTWILRDGDGAPGDPKQVEWLKSKPLE